MTKLSTAAWVAHELGLAASFGGVLFGTLALNPNLDVVESKPDRGKLLNKAWNRYNAVSIASTGTAIATWLAGVGSRAAWSTRMPATWSSPRTPC